MLQKTISFIAVLSMILGISLPVLAQTKPKGKGFPLPPRDLRMGNATTTPSMMQDKKDMMKDKIQQRMGKMEDKRKALIKKHFEKMMKRFEAAVMRLKKLADRIDSRLTKFGEKGKDVVALKAKLAEAKTKIDDAVKVIEAAKAKFAAIPDSEKPKEMFKEVKDLVSEARDKTKEAHAALVKVVTQIKGASGGTATTTPPVTP